VGESERGAASEGPLRLDVTGPPEDGADATATITTAPGPGAGVRAAGSRPVRRPRSRRRKAVLAGGALAFVAVVGGVTVLTLYRAVPTAMIRLALAPRALGHVPIPITISISDPTDPGSGTVQGQLAPVVVRASAVVTATDLLPLGDRARGTVTFSNASRVPVPVPDLTEVATQDGVVFRTQESILAIPPGGTESVEIRAAEQGTEGNVEAGTITVIVSPDLQAQLGPGGGVTNTEATSGGTTADTPVFSQEDYDRAVAQLTENLTASLATAVPEPQDGIVAYPGTAQQTGVPAVDQDSLSIVGSLGPETTITGSLGANVLTASAAQIEQVAQRMLADAAAPDSVVPGAVITLGEPTVAVGRVTYDAIGDALVYGLPVTYDELREQVRSKTIAEAQRILGQYGTATITLSPDFLPALPDDPNRIEIETGPPPPGATPAPMTSPPPSIDPRISPAPSGLPVAPSLAPSAPPSAAPSLAGPSAPPSAAPSLAGPSLAPSARSSAARSPSPAPVPSA
jgi:hypothetical protein